jgi:hypothetical protein
MPQPIKMKIKLHIIIWLVSAVGRATVSVMCFTRTGRSSTTGKTHFFYLRTANCSENKFDRFFYIHTWIWYQIFYYPAIKKYTKKIDGNKRNKYIL